MKHHQTVLQALASSGLLLAMAHAGGDVPSSNFKGQVVSIQMIDAQTGWACGESSNSAALLQTHDGGKSWTDISPRLLQAKEGVSSSGDAPSCVSFKLLDTKHGWTAFAMELSDLSATILYSTEDGGHNWQQNSFKTKVGGVTSIQFTDAEHGFILVESDAALGKSQKATYRTTDGGSTWQTTSEVSWGSQTDGVLPERGFTEGMVFRNARDGWVAGSPRADEAAYFFRTQDGGKTWRQQIFPRPQGFSGGYAEFHTPWFFGDKKTDGVLSASFIQHDPEQYEMDFYATQDGGEHWQRVGVAPAGVSDHSATDQVFVDVKRGWIMTGDGQLFATTDGAVTWQKVGSKLHLGDKESVSQIDFIDSTQGWLVKADSGSGDVHELLQTTDGGHTWAHCFGPEGASARP